MKGLPSYLVDKRFKHRITGIGIEWIDDDGFHRLTQVHPESVCRYTGFKDSEGNEIYEGDLIEFTYWWFDSV